LAGFAFMTKKHFIALADHIKRENQGERLIFCSESIRSLSNFCASQNPQFNHGRWLDYVYGHAGKNGGTKGKHTDER
jgi:hypothetical protein